MKVTAELVRSLFDYDKDTGVLLRKVSSSSNAKAGAVVGWLNGCGYLNVRICTKSYKVHRVIWLHVTGQWPIGVIDHINRVKTDNRFSNLRDTTVEVNNINKGVMKSSKTGIPNVTWRERDKMFYAAMSHKGQQNYLGSFKSAKLAAAAVEEFKAKIGRAMP